MVTPTPPSDSEYSWNCNGCSLESVHYQFVTINESKMSDSAEINCSIMIDHEKYTSGPIQLQVLGKYCMFMSSIIIVYAVMSCTIQNQKCYTIHVYFQQKWFRKEILFYVVLWFSNKRTFLSWRCLLWWYRIKLCIASIRDLLFFLFSFFVFYILKKSYNFYASSDQAEIHHT